MYKVVIADDEEIIRKGLMEKVHWGKYGFQIVGEADNGLDALELVEQEEPDLVITDIRMPLLTGIELAREIRQIRPMVSIVFLSGYDDFTYAQQAIQYDIISYLLKPITVEEFEEELVKIKLHLDEKFASFIKDADEWRRLEKSEFLYPLLLDSHLRMNVTEEKIQEEAKEHNFDIGSEHRDKQFLVFVTQILDENGEIHMPQNGVDAIDAIVGKYAHSMSCNLKGRIVTVVEGTSRELNKYTQIFTEEISQSVERTLHMRCIIGVSRKVDRMLKCRECYLDAMNALYYAINNESNLFFIGDEEESHQYSHDEIKFVTEELERLIRGGETSELTAYLNHIEELGVSSKIPRVIFGYIVSQMLSTVFEIVYTVAGDEAVALLQNMYEQDQEEYPDVMLMQFEQVKKICIAAKEIVVKKRRQSSNRISKQTLELIEKEFGNQQLSVQYASNKIGVSSNYLSMIIKKETGVTFVELMTRKRIEYAKKLLKETDLKIKEVAEQCGYSDQYYFSHCFKKIAGMSPGGYRKSYDK